MSEIDRLLSSTAVTITPEEASKLLKCKPQSIRLAARERPDLLGFPVIVMGKETRIPRIPFMRFLGLEKEDNNG